MKRNTDLDLIRAILIILMILIHIVSFGNAYPHLKAGILSFMMPTFLIITGYLVNIEKTGRQMGNYLKCLALPYVIMVTGFSVLSYYMPVRDGITELSLSQIGEKIFITSIGPYWFIQTMIICGTLYYFSFRGRNWNDLHKNYTKRDTYASLFVFALTLLLISETPALSASAAAYYFIGVVIRQSKTEWSKLFRHEFFAIFLWIYLLYRDDWYDWGNLAIVFSCWCCISCLLFLQHLLDIPERFKDFSPMIEKVAKVTNRIKDTLIIYRAQHAAYLSLPPHLYDGCEVLSSPLCLGSERDFVCCRHRYPCHYRQPAHRQGDGEDQTGLSLRKREIIKINPDRSIFCRKNIC